MFKFIVEERDKILKYAASMKKIKFDRHIEGGLDTSVVVFEDGRRSEDIKEIAEYLNATLLYYSYDSTYDSSPDYCILLKSDRYSTREGPRITRLSQHTFKVGITRLIHTSIFFEEGLIFFETEEEVEWYRGIIRVAEISKEIESIEAFLNDPWKGYEGKKKDFEKKLEKAKAATNHKIEEETNRLEALKKQKEELEKGCLLGKNKNRED